MKRYKFMVVLESMQAEAHTSTKEEAVILVQADAIKLGLNHKLVSVTKIYY